MADTVKVIYHGEFHAKVAKTRKNDDGEKETFYVKEKLEGGKVFGFQCQTGKPFLVPADFYKLDDWRQCQTFTVDGKRAKDLTPKDAAG